MLNSDLVLFKKKEMLNFVSRIVSAPSLFNEFLSATDNVVFDNYALNVFYEKGCIYSFLKLFATDYGYAIKLDLAGLCPNIRTEIVTYFKSTTQINESILCKIMLQVLMHDETMIFTACLEAIKGAKLNLVSVFRTVVNIGKSLDCIEINKCSFERNISNCIHKNRATINVSEAVKMIKHMIKSGFSYDVLPTTVDECLLFGNVSANCFKKIFGYACTYGNKSFVSGLMKYHKKYVTEEIIKEFTCVSLNTVLLISNARNDDSEVECD